TAKNPNRFVALGTIPLQDTDLAIAELERCMTDLKMIGVQIGSHVKTENDDLNLSDSRLFPFFEACEKLGAAIFVHPWDMMGEAQIQKYWLPW
ncbi:amidohydrolase family protein, partial [Enterococcus faecium]